VPLTTTALTTANGWDVLQITANSSARFEIVAIDLSLLGSREQRALLTQKGAVNVNAFVSLVRQAVQGKWIEAGRMRHAQ